MTLCGKHEHPDGTLAVFYGPRCLARYRAQEEVPQVAARSPLTSREYV
jgi:hypothetical protein